MQTIATKMTSAEKEAQIMKDIHASNIKFEPKFEGSFFGTFFGIAFRAPA
jgi:hypothetical protein